MSRKLLFLPHCLRQDYLDRLQDEGKKRSYEVHIAKGGSMVKNILLDYEDISRVVGVACEDELSMAREYTKTLKEDGIEIIAVRLTTDGCKDTEVNLEEVIEALI